MKKTYLFIVATILSIHLSAQNFDWAKREGLYEYDYGYGVVTDNSGNVYVAGKYEQVGANFSGVTVPCQGNHDIFLVKYDAAGTMSWVTTGGGVHGDYAHALACDGSYLYVAGEIEGYGDQITFQNSGITLTSVGDNDAFVAKYDLNGTILWAKSVGGLNNEKAQGVTYDNSGNVYITGFFNDTAYFGSTTLVGNGDDDMFLAKYDANGNFQWVRSAGSAGRDEGKGVKCDASGNVYVCGMHSDACSFGSQVLASPNNYFNGYIAKYDGNGNLLWVNTLGGDVDDVAWSLTMDNAGKIYVGGEYNAYAVFGPYSLLATPGGNADIFVACYDAAGTAMWAKGAGGALIDRARGIGCDGTNIYITGQFGSAATFGGQTMTAVDSSDVFISALDNNGNFLWTTAVGGVADSVETLGYESGNAICAEPSGAVYATGAILDGGIFGATSYGKYSRTDVFVTRISQTTGINDLVDNNAFSLYPNPSSGSMTIEGKNLDKSGAEVRIYNSMGMLVEKHTMNATDKLSLNMTTAERGIYYAEVKSGAKIARRKIVIQ